MHENVYDEIVQKISLKFASKKIGNAVDVDSDIGPLVAKRQLDTLTKQVEESKVRGAKIITGGRSLEKELNGAFFEPTVMTNVATDMRVWKEEVFGPVLPVIKFKNIDEAILLANDGDYGLGAYVYTADVNKAEKIANSVKSGMVSVNNVNYVLPCNPFGGYKSSGLGRQHGKFGFHEVTQIKVIAKNK